TNSGFARGGAIRHNGGIFSISGCTFNGNISANGGGLAIDAGNGMIEDSLFQSNAAANGSGNGGGLFITNAGGASAVVTNCDFIQNSSNLYGGGISNLGTLNAFNVRVTNNQAFLGGGIASNRGTVTIENSSISGNTGGNAGGICNGCN